MQGVSYESTGLHRIVMDADLALPPERASERSTFWVAPLPFARLTYWLSQRTLTVKHPDGRVESVDNLFPRSLAIVRDQLRSVDNFPSDRPLPYPSAGTAEERDAYIARLGWEGVLELAGKVLDQAFVGDDAKNS